MPQAHTKPFALRFAIKFKINLLHFYLLYYIYQEGCFPMGKPDKIWTFSRLTYLSPFSFQNKICKWFISCFFKKFFYMVLSFVYTLVRAECVRCPWLQAERKVATILGIFSTLVVGAAVIRNTRRGCRRVSNFCMGS